MAGQHQEERQLDDDDPFIVLTETKFSGCIVLTETKPSNRHIPVWARYPPLRTSGNGTCSIVPVPWECQTFPLVSENPRRGQIVGGTVPSLHAE